MNPEQIPPGVHALLQNHVVSLEQLQILLLMRERPGESWSIASLSCASHIPPDLVCAALDALCKSRLVRQTGGPTWVFRYAPVAPLRPDVDALARAFDEQRAVIMSIMSTHAIERIRLSAIRAFADSFLIRKKNHDD